MGSANKGRRGRGRGLALGFVCLVLGACEGMEPQIDPLTSKDDCAGCPPGLFTAEERDLVFYP